MSTPPDSLGMELEPTGPLELAKDALALVGVGCYLGAAGALLAARRRLRVQVPLSRLLASRALERGFALTGRAPRAGSLAGIEPLEGRAYRAQLPVLPTDVVGGSSVEVYEDGQPLGPGHAPRAEVIAAGGGRYLHYGIVAERRGFLSPPRLYTELLFSTSDDTDPRTNGRTYTYRCT